MTSMGIQHRLCRQVFTPGQLITHWLIKMCSLSRFVAQTWCMGFPRRFSCTWFGNGSRARSPRAIIITHLACMPWKPGAGVPACSACWGTQPTLAQDLDHDPSYTKPKQARLHMCAHLCMQGAASTIGFNFSLSLHVDIVSIGQIYVYFDARVSGIYNLSIIYQVGMLKLSTGAA